MAITLQAVRAYATTAACLRAMREYMGHPTPLALQLSTPAGAWVRCCPATPASAGVLLRAASASWRADPLRLTNG